MSDMSDVVSEESWGSLQHRLLEERTPAKWLGLGLGIAIFTHYLLWTLGWERLGGSHLGAGLSALALANHLDLRLRALWAQPQGRYSLDGLGLQTLKETTGLTSMLIDDASLTQPALVFYDDELSDDLSGPYDIHKRISSALSHPETLHNALTVPITQISTVSRHLSGACVVCRLPHLPSITGRDQLGVFAQSTLSPGDALLWRSDFGVKIAREQERRYSADDHDSLGALDDLGYVEMMNRRPVLRLKFPPSPDPSSPDPSSPDPSNPSKSSSKSQSQAEPRWIEVSQGLSEIQRSNGVALVNFSWCHTESIDASSSPYRILPPHDLGRANCHFTTVLDPQVTLESGAPRLCSALVIDRPIQVGEQLLAFTGSGSNLRTVKLRRSLSLILTLITPALVLMPWLIILYQIIS